MQLTSNPLKYLLIEGNHIADDSLCDYFTNWIVLRMYTNTFGFGIMSSFGCRCNHYSRKNVYHAYTMPWLRHKEPWHQIYLLIEGNHISDDSLCDYFTNWIVLRMYTNTFGFGIMSSFGCRCNHYSRKKCLSCMHNALATTQRAMASTSVVPTLFSQNICLHYQVLKIQ